MIKSLEISNFQSHKQSKLEFANGVNVIVGGSDTGKTSIIRALRWLIWNRPTGDAFRSTWDGSTSVDIVIDRQNIVRIKDQAGSEYALGETIFKAFGTEVPEEILHALNINEINLQSQLDSPFLLSSSPGEVAQHFNRVAHLDQIDNGLRKVQQWIRAIEQDIHSGKKQTKQLEEDLQEFVHLDVFEEDVEVLEGMQSQLINKANVKNKLNDLIISLENILDKIEEESKIIEAEELLNNILEWIENRNTKQQQNNQLIYFTEQIKGVTNEINERQDIVPAEKPVLELLDLFNDKKELEINLVELQVLINSINNTGEEQSGVQILLNADEKLFKEMFPDICPLCNQKVKKS